MDNVKVAIMQPYLFPYIGYFQLISLSDFFVFYDDVNFIKRGWINRNRILMNGKPIYLTIPCNEISQNKMIKEVTTALTDKSSTKILRTVEQCYSKAPFFNSIMPLIEKVVQNGNMPISELAIESVRNTCIHLGINSKMLKSSEAFIHTKSKDRADRLISITKHLKGTTYINAIGGQDLYNREYFKEQGIDLAFIKTLPMNYRQNNKTFVENLSIIDVMMFNDIEEIQGMLKKFDFIHAMY